MRMEKLEIVQVLTAQILHPVKAHVCVEQSTAVGAAWGSPVQSSVDGNLLGHWVVA